MPDAEYFRHQAEHCRHLARLSRDASLTIKLVDMADEYEARARELA
jgi:hypothetical protein